MNQETINKIKWLGTIAYCNCCFTSRPRYVLEQERKTIDKLMSMLKRLGVSGLSVFCSSRTVVGLFNDDSFCINF